MTARRKEAAPQVWLVAAFEIERAIQGDDRRGAVRQRRAALNALADAASGPACPDGKLFALFDAAVREWADRNDPDDRARLEGPALSYARSVRAVARRPEPQWLPGIMRGVPEDDR